jgi:DNA-binding XRE family transcriptional regulator
MKIIITKNNIDAKINEYIKNTGATKTWIASQLEMSPQRMYQLYKADNMMMDVAFRFAEFLQCDIKDLFEYDVIK